jgi:hypothetical protein
MFVVAKVRRIVDSMPNLGNRPSHPEQPGKLAVTISHTFLAISERLYRDDNDNDDTRGGTDERGRCDHQLVSSVEFPVSARVTRKDMVNVSGSTAPQVPRSSLLSTSTYTSWPDPPT